MCSWAGYTSFCWCARRTAGVYDKEGKPEDVTTTATHQDNCCRVQKRHVELHLAKASGPSPKLTIAQHTDAHHLG